MVSRTCMTTLGTFIGELQVSLYTNPADLVVPLASDRIVVCHLKKNLIY